jgi:DNA-binding NarL/FixJ family response regulator
MRILIADNQSKVRYALSVLLQEQQGWKIVGSAVDAGDVLAKIISLKPDVLLLDWVLPGLLYADLLSAIRRLSENLMIISISPTLRYDSKFFPWARISLPPKSIHPSC